MKRSTEFNATSGIAAWSRRAATVAAVLTGGLGLAAAVFAANEPVPPTVPAVATPYSWPTFHAGGTVADAGGTADTGGGQTLPYGQLQGTPTGLYSPTFGGTTGTLDQIPSLILGNTGAGVATAPPGSGGTNGYLGTAGNYSVPSFLNHFNNGPLFQAHYFQIQGPLAWNLPNPVVANPNVRVEGSPVVVNATQFPEIGYMFYTGVEAAGSIGAITTGNNGIYSQPATNGTGTPPGANGALSTLVTTGTNAIRQVVYFGRTEVLPVILDPTASQAAKQNVYTLGGVPVPTDANGNPTIAEGTPVSVGAIYAMDGFTGGIIWRYQTPAFTSASVATFNGFSATITNAQANSATTNGPQPFQIGPNATSSGGTPEQPAIPGPDATFSSYTPYGNINAGPANKLDFSVYASTATQTSATTVNYSGDWRIYTAGTTPDAGTLATGTFTATATFDLTKDPTGHYANVTGTFNITPGTSPTFAIGFPAQFNGTFDSSSGQQLVSGTLTTILGGGTGAVLRSGQVFSSLSVARLNVPVPTGYPQAGQGNTASPNLATKLVVIATDNNGYVYCLDALGNGYRDPYAASNSNVLYQSANINAPNYTTDKFTVGQVHYDVNASPVPVTGANGAYNNIKQSYNSYPNDNQWHIGTTFPYWVYRPDASQPLYPPGNANAGTVKVAADRSTQTDLPVPQAFVNSSPTVYLVGGAQVDYSLPTTFGTLAPGAGPASFTTTTTVNGNPVTTAPPLARNGIIYAGSSNGVLYALDPTGQSTATAGDGNSYNAPVTGNPGISDDTLMPETLWWFQAPGADPSATDNPVSITSAPAVLANDPSYGNKPTVYVGTSNPLGGADNSGRLYAIDALNGPTGNDGATPGSNKPGSALYNVNSEGRWSFPSVYPNLDPNNKNATYAALGNITGSPVVFYNAHDQTTRIYFAANTGSETVTTSGTTTQAFPASDDNGRVWAVNTDGHFSDNGLPGFVYPGATSGSADPNQTTLPAMNPPLGGFLHATPAIGYVTYPASIYYLDATGNPTAWTHSDTGTGGNGAVTFNGSPGPTEPYPMLYIGTFTQGGVSLVDPSLYFLDLDGVNDTERTMSSVLAPNSSSFQSSPILVTNTSPSGTTGGNGGSIFITDSANNLLQFQATPITTANTSDQNPEPRLDYTFPFGDAVSTPAVGAAVVADITATNPLTGTTEASQQLTDWVYVGDVTSGLCFGATPQGFGTDTTNGYYPVIGPPVPPQVNYSPVVTQFPMRAYIFDGTTAHPANSLDMNQSNPYGPNASLPAFEWGQNVYFRIANVVPPQTPLSATDLVTSGDNGTVQDPTSPGSYFGGGGPITIQTTEIDSSGQTIPGTVDTFTISPTPTLITDPSVSNGFAQRTDTGTLPANFGNSSENLDANTPRAPETLLRATNGKGYVACSTYSIGFSSTLDSQGLTRHNTPGARRKLINVTQTVTHYTAGASGSQPTTQQIQLQLVADPNFSYEKLDTTSGSPTAGTVPATGATTGNLYIDEPTFGILNPLAVRAAGIGLTGGGTHAPWADSNGQEGVGPFRGVNTKLLSTDMEALANGNSVLTNPPPSSVLATNTSTTPTTGTGILVNSATAYQPYFRYVIAASNSQIGHGSTGNNSDPNNPATANYQYGLIDAAQKQTDGANVSGLIAPTGSGAGDDIGFGDYTFNIADRSMLGLPVAGGTTPKGNVYVSMRRSRLGWNDNTGAAGPGARINPLPWEDLPLVGTNSSVDYPDIAATNLNEYLNGDTAESLVAPSKQSLAGANQAAGATTDATFRQVLLSPVNVSIHVPKYQPANLQLWNRNGTASGAIIPQNYKTAGGLIFPMGYVAHQRIAATSNPNTTPNTRDPNTAYREVYVYTGVPVDMSTSISNQTTDVGVVPHGFGVQMDGSTLLSGYAPGIFSPYTQYPGFMGHFQPLTIYNNGNTNLLNPHLDQKIQQPGAPQTPLPLLSDALDSSYNDPLSFIPGFDFGGVRTGLNASGSQGNYLVRSSLDNDLASALGHGYGIYPGVDPTKYPTVTFHKPRVSDGTNPNFPGTLMTVPDLPHDNSYQHATLGPNQLPLTPGNSQNGQFAYLPYVGVAVPLGTPVGTYSQTVRMFEGRDPNYDPLIGPTYGGAFGGYQTFTPTANSDDVFTLLQNTTTQQAVAAQPYTEPGTNLIVSVQEDRLTDGFLPGSLPMFDNAAAFPGSLVLAPPPLSNSNSGPGAADFLPAAFRDPQTGNMSLFWTSGRVYQKNTNNPLYGILGANLAYNGSNGNQYFQPFVGTTTINGNSVNLDQWWNNATPDLTALGGSNVGWAVASDQRYAYNGSLNTNSDNSAYAFDVNVTGPAATTTSAVSGANTMYSIYCYAMTPGTGAITGKAVPVANSPQPKSGVHGLKFTGVSFTDPNGGSAIANDLWAFWAGGARGRTALYYSSAASSAVTGYGGGSSPSPFTGAAVLPVPVNLVSISGPTAVLTYAPDPTTGPTGTAIPVIEVTYAGTNAAGVSSLYISRFRPYHPKSANGQVNSGVTLLTPLPFRNLTEQLQSDPTSNWWQSRDSGWLRNAALNVSETINTINNGTATTVFSNSLLTDQTKTNPDGSHPLYPGIQETYDRASGLLVFTGVGLPSYNRSTNTVTTVPNQTITMDLGTGRVRFSIPQTNITNKVYSIVTAQFNPMARRITTDPVANTAPTVFLDESYEPSASGTGNVIADRYWFLWQKPAVADEKLGPTLWSKTQRLTVVVTDANGQPIPLSSASAGSVPVDVDTTRGRVYFPITSGNVAMEGQQVTITYTPVGGNTSSTFNGTVHWLDEPRYNDSSSQIVANDTTPGAIEAGAPDGYQVPIRTTVNESGVTAFLDPIAYNNTSSVIAAPPSVWLFWTSTRNGTSDIYYETINPRFAPVTPLSGAP